MKKVDTHTFCECLLSCYQMQFRFGNTSLFLLQLFSCACVLDRRPFDLAKEGGDRNRQPGHHEQWKGEQVAYLLHGCGPDALPFGQRGKRAEREQAAVSAQESAEQFPQRI